MAKKSRAKTVKTLRDYWQKDGVVIPPHDKALRQWLEKNAGGVDIATFIHSCDHEKKHSKAIKQLIR